MRAPTHRDTHKRMLGSARRRAASSSAASRHTLPLSHAISLLAPRVPAALHARTHVPAAALRLGACTQSARASRSSSSPTRWTCRRPRRPSTACSSSSSTRSETSRGTSRARRRPCPRCVPPLRAPEACPQGVPPRRTPDAYPRCGRRALPRRTAASADSSTSASLNAQRRRAVRFRQDAHGPEPPSDIRCVARTASITLRVCIPAARSERARTVCTILSPSAVRTSCI
eukprot:6202556-Pleurochrysis_carterae.AAC.2